MRPSRPEPAPAWPVSPWALLAPVALAPAVWHYNRPLFYLLNGFAPGLFGPAMVLATSLADGLIVLMALALLQPRRRDYFIPAVAAFLVSGLAVAALKSGFALPRPIMVLPQGSFLLLDRPIRTRSFPSGHSAAVFVLALYALQGVRGPARLGIWAAAFVGALSRVYVGVHFPFDVLVGGWLGAATTALALRFKDRFPRVPDVGAALFGLIVVLAYIFLYNEKYRHPLRLLIPLTSLLGLYFAWTAVRAFRRRP